MIKNRSGSENDPEEKMKLQIQIELGKYSTMLRMNITYIYHNFMHKKVSEQANS
jgi:hypothetical protein